MNKVPEVKEALSEGKLTLTSTARLACFVKRENTNLTQTLELLQKCENQSIKKVEKLFLENSTQEIPLLEKIKPVTSEITRITLEVDEEFMSLVKRMKELKGNHSLPVKEVFKIAMSEYVQKREPKAPQKSSSVEKSAAQQQTRYIPTSIKNQIRLRSKDQCEYRDPLSKNRCESKTGLEFDHKEAYALGGTNEIFNIRHLCKTHNLHYAIKTYVLQKMRPYLRVG